MRLIQICAIAIKGIALTMTLMLVGCIDLKQSIEISDGVASYQMEMRMSAALAQLDAENLGKFCDGDGHTITSHIYRNSESRITVVSTGT